MQITYPDRDHMLVSGEYVDVGVKIVELTIQGPSIGRALKRPGIKSLSFRILHWNCHKLLSAHLTHYSCLNPYWGLSGALPPPKGAHGLVDSNYRFGQKY